MLGDRDLLNPGVLRPNERVLPRVVVWDVDLSGLLSRAPESNTTLNADRRSY